MTGTSMHCNIDQRGRRIRFAAGILAVAAGLLVLLLAPGGWLTWSIAAVLALAGGFSVFEGVKGWCGLRAMGIRTPW